MKKSRGHSEWTPRLVMRLAGAVVLAAVLLMAVLGVFVFELKMSANAFFIFWSVFFLLLLIAIAIAMLDALATIGKFKIEHDKLRSAFQKEPEGNLNSWRRESETKT